MMSKMTSATTARNTSISKDDVADAGGWIMDEKRAISWFEKRIGNLIGFKKHERDEAYRLAIMALKDRQVCQEQKK